MKYLKKSVHFIERGAEGIRDFLWKPEYNSTNSKIIIYHGYRTDGVLVCKGRLLARTEENRATAEDDLVTNAKRMFGYLNSKEIPFETVTLIVDGNEFVKRTDEEGYFHFEVNLNDTDESKSTAWTEVEVTCELNDGIIKQKGWIQHRLPEAAIGIISDIDDTIMESEATNFIKLIGNTFSGNEHTRLAFNGVSELYQSLIRGNNLGITNPIFYLSNGPWNFFDFLNYFMELNEIPRGSFMLRDYGVDSEKFLKDDRHKVSTIRKILEDHKKLSFILIGDSGEKDPEFYHEIVKEYPDRIKAVYIRDVSNEKRDKQVLRISELVKNNGVPMLLVNNSLEIAEHCLLQNWISEDSLVRIRKELI